MDDIRRALARWGLYRSSRSRLLGGVFAGIGERLGMGPWTARLIFTIALLAIPGSQLLVYPVLWVLMPSSPALPGGSYGPPPGGTSWS